MDKHEINRLIEEFCRNAKPNDINPNHPATKDDLIKLVDAISKLLKSIT